VKNKTSMKSISVKVRKLDTILAEHAPEVKGIDILAVDVEGWELNVMRGLSVTRYRPGVVILENLFNDSNYLTYMNDQVTTAGNRSSRMTSMCGADSP
jgi:hypothetical protein